MEGNATILAEFQSSGPDAVTPAQPEIPPEFNLLQPDFRQNPYSTYRQFRAVDPVHEREMLGVQVYRHFEILSLYYVILKPAPTHALCR